MINTLDAAATWTTTTASTMERDGFSIVEAFAPPAERARLLQHLGSVVGPGQRNLLSVPAIAEFSCAESTLASVRQHMANEPMAVRAIYFNKSAEANWLVPWHQDLTIAVRERREVAGFGPWSSKDGVPHVQPPAKLMERMLALRVHFDDADLSNGALRVIGGTHRFGRLSATRIQQLRAELPDSVCSARAGDALLMRPLLLHASAQSTSSRPRRVLHIEYADFNLPAGLEWHYAAAQAN